MNRLLSSLNKAHLEGAMPIKPLDGLRVLDFTWVRAGPWATRWLGLLGADVIKVEWPDPALGGYTGRMVRAFPGFGTTPPGVEPTMNTDGHFSDNNIHKRSVTINTRSEKGIAAVKRLVALSDVVIENFSRGVLDGWGLGYDEMTKLRGDVIYVSM